MNRKIQHTNAAKGQLSASYVRALYQQRKSKHKPFNIAYISARAVRDRVVVPRASKRFLRQVDALITNWKRLYSSLAEAINAAFCKLLDAMPIARYCDLTVSDPLPKLFNPVSHTQHGTQGKIEIR